MIPSEINIQIDEKAIREHVEKKLDEVIQTQLWFVDVARISELTGLSKRFLEDTVLSDVRMRAIERKKSRKRFYPAKQAFEVINEITSEW